MKATKPRSRVHAIDAVDGGREVGVQDGGPLVQRLPPVDREVDDGDVHGGDEGPDGTAPGPGVGIARHPAQRQVAELEHEQQRGRGEPGVPGPPHPPGGPAPDGPGHQGEGGEDHPHLHGRRPPAGPRTGCASGATTTGRWTRRRCRRPDRAPPRRWAGGRRRAGPGCAGPCPAASPTARARRWRPATATAATPRPAHDPGGPRAPRAGVPTAVAVDGRVTTPPAGVRR